MAISKIKFDVYVEQFPVLAEVFAELRVKAEDCDRIEIARADVNLMTHAPQYSGASGSLVGIDDGERIAFVLDDGSVIHDAVKTSGYVRHNEAHTDDESWSGETVLDAIYRHSVPDTLALIVSVRYGYEVRDHYSEDNWSAAVYKTPKGFTYRQIVDEARARALAEVQAESEF
jgi:hypothetical protein